MRYLRDLDAVAFVRFASVYRQFNDVYDFFEELRPMLGESPQDAAVRDSCSVRGCGRQGDLCPPAFSTLSSPILDSVVACPLEYEPQLASGPEPLPGR